MDRTLILVKPDAFARGLTGEIIARFERKGLRIAALKHMTMDTELAEQHYAEHDGKPFFDELVSFITSGPLVAMVLEGDKAVPTARQVIGATNPLEAATGSIRGDFAVEVGQNMVHGSDSDRSPPSARRTLFFPNSDPRVRLAAAAGDPRAGRDRRSRSGRRASRRRRPGDPRGSRTRTRAARRSRSRRAPASARPRRRHRVALDGESSASRATRPRPRAFLGRLSGRTHEVVGGIVLAARRRGARQGGRAHGVSSEPSTRRLDGYVSWRGARPRRRLAIQGRGAALITEIRATISSRRAAAGTPLATPPGTAAHGLISRVSAQGVR